jgi:4-hydroxy-tetrahydrodipicolinate reductase
MVVGTTGWYDRLQRAKEAAERKGASLLYGTNFSVGVQTMLRLAEIMTKELAGLSYHLSISETHHLTKLDAPSGTALTLRDVVTRASGMGDIPIKSIRHGEAVGLHVLEAETDGDRILLTHESHSRRPFAEGAVRAAEWLVNAPAGVYDFRDVFTKL